MSIDALVWLWVCSDYYPASFLQGWTKPLVIGQLYICGFQIISLRTYILNHFPINLFKPLWKRITITLAFRESTNFVLSRLSAPQTLFM